ncbi:hypothetical protein [uncultured Methylobacterium sp.]|jgi:hypothetical protein|uniref:hypothetical protein n=1 Tax=uncultured Methylobacterium sp. TaxID=157278 RepID=UPI0026265D77|nr:hypothetical protein [uncultured Methylobacterium sp.]
MRTLIAALASLFLLQAGANAQSSDEERNRVCGADVMRLCLNAIPDRPRIIACMQSQRENLSPACRALFDRERGGAVPGRRG